MVHYQIDYDYHHCLSYLHIEFYIPFVVINRLLYRVHTSLNQNQNRSPYNIRHVELLRMFYTSDFFDACLHLLKYFHLSF